MLRMERPCAVLDDYFIQYWQSAEIKKLTHNLNSLLTLVRDKAGLPPNMTIMDTEHVTDTLFCEVHALAISWFLVIILSQLSIHTHRIFSRN